MITQYNKNSDYTDIKYNLNQLISYRGLFALLATGDDKITDDNWDDVLEKTITHPDIMDILVKLKNDGKYLPIIDELNDRQIIHQINTHKERLVNSPGATLGINIGYRQSLNEIQHKLNHTTMDVIY